MQFRPFLYQLLHLLGAWGWIALCFIWGFLALTPTLPDLTFLRGLYVVMCVLAFHQGYRMLLRRY
mgnify:CR=1 FL=1